MTVGVGVELSGGDKRGPVRKNTVWHVDLNDIPLTSDEHEESLRKRLSEIILDNKFELPPMPAIAQEILVASAKPNIDIKGLARIAHRDAFVAGRVLRVANSAHYGFRVPAETLADAIVRVGVKELRNIVFVLAMKGEVFRYRGFERVTEPTWRHSLATAIAAGMVAAATSRVKRHRAFLAGLLHDIGVPIIIKATMQLLKERPDEREMIVRRSPSMAAKLHCEVGGLVASRWKLDAGLRDVLLHHHDPMKAREDRVLAAHIALAEAAASQLCGQAPGDRPSVDPEPFLKSFQIDRGFFDERIVALLPDKLEAYQVSIQS